MYQGQKIIVKGFSSVFEQMCNFMAVAKTGKPNETVEGLIQLCFVLKPEDKFQIYASFAEQIELLFGLEIPEHQIQVAIEAMTNKGIVSKPAGTNFVLDVKLKQQIKERIEGAQKLEERVKKSWLESIAQKYPELPIEKMWPTLQGYLSRAFRRHGMQTAFLVDPSIETPGEYTESLSQLLMEVIEDKCETKERPYAKKAISTFLTEVATDEERSKYITQLADGAFNFYILEISPDLTAKLQANLNEMVLFLDTNFLFGILGLHNNSQVEVSHELIRTITAHKLPFRLRYHEATMREMRHTISYYSTILRERRWSRGLSRAASTLTDLSGLEIKYHEQNAIQNIDVDEFLRPYQHLDVFLKEKGIDIYRSTEERLQERTDLHHEYEAFLKKHGREDKTYETINHDATVLDAVRLRRSNSPSTLEAGALLVSCDYLLSLFDHKTACRSNHMACVVFPNNFWQILRPFIPSDRDFEMSFAQTFALPEFRAIGSKGSQACSKMLSILASYRTRSEETAFKMLSNDMLLDKLKATKNDEQFAECVEAAFVEENKNLMEEKAALAMQLKKEEKDRAVNKKAAAAKERAATEKLQALERESAKLQKTLSKKESEVQQAKSIAEASQEEHKEAKRELDKIKETVTAEKKARSKVELEKDSLQFKNRLGIAFIVSLLIIALFEISLHYFIKWSWLLNNKNAISLEIGFDLLIGCVVFSVFVSRWRKKSLIFAGGTAVIMLIPLLGGYNKSADSPSPTQPTIIKDSQNIANIPTRSSLEIILKQYRKTQYDSMRKELPDIYEKLHKRFIQIPPEKRTLKFIAEMLTTFFLPRGSNSGNSILFEGKMSPQPNVTLYDWVENYENEKVDKSLDTKKINTRIGRFVYDFTYETVLAYLGFSDLGNDPNHKNYNDPTITDLKKEFIDTAIEEIYLEKLRNDFDCKMSDAYEEERKERVESIK